MAADHDHWMVLQHNGDARLATVLKPWAPSAGWSSDEPIMKGEPRLAAVQSGSRQHWVVLPLSIFSDLGGLLGFCFIAQVYSGFPSWQATKAQFTIKKRSSQLVWVIYSSHLEHVFYSPLTLKGSSCVSSDGERDTAKSKRASLAKGDTARLRLVFAKVDLRAWGHFGDFGCFIATSI